VDDIYIGGIQMQYEIYIGDRKYEIVIDDKKLQKGKRK